MKRFLFAMAVVLVVSGAGIALLYGLPEQPKPPNVVFLLLDTLRFDRVEATRGGYEVMPNLRRYALESRNFANTIAACSWTRPSMASIYTSMPVDAHKVYYAARGETGEALRTTDILREEHTTPAEWLRSLGYQTFGVQTNANMLPELGFAQGFDKDDYPFESGGIGEWVTDTALGGAWAMDEPFFLYAHYMDVHAPYGGPDGYEPPWDPIEDVPDAERALVDGKDFVDFTVEEAHESVGVPAEDRFPELSEAGKEYVRAQYDAAAHYLDKQVGRLIERLRRDFPNTIFVIAADHGEELWERGGMGHGLTLNAEQVRVPFIVFGANVTPKQVAMPASLIDIFPTVAGLAGLPPLETWQGLDLSTTDPDAARERFSRTRGPRPLFHIDLIAGIASEDKLIYDLYRQRESLYDLETDPQELEDLSGAQPERATELRKQIEAHLSDSKALEGPLVVAPTTTLGQENLDALEAMGYLGGEPEPAPNTAPLAP